MLRTRGMKLVVAMAAVAALAWLGAGCAKVEPSADAPSSQSPDLAKLKAVIGTKTSEGRLAIGVRIMDGEAPATDVRKDGQPVQVKMVVTDAAGTEVASKTGPLSDFGFS